MSKTSLHEFLEFIVQIDDEQLLEVAEGLMPDIAEIERKKEEIDALEAGLSDGDRVVFWMEAMSLNREEIDIATNKIKGRRRFLKDQAERAALANQPDEEPSDEENDEE
jgi:endo-1,4-beta-D-glucanase Y